MIVNTMQRVTHEDLSLIRRTRMGGHPEVLEAHPIIEFLYDFPVMTKRRRVSKNLLAHGSISGCYVPILVSCPISDGKVPNISSLKERSNLPSDQITTKAHNG